MRLVASANAAALEGRLVYVEAEHSFRFDVESELAALERAGSDGVTSLSIGTLQVEVGVATGTVLFAWGLHPRATWRAEPIGEPLIRSAAVGVEDATLRRGVSVRLAPVGSWTTTFDCETGWVRLAPTGPHDAADQIFLVATGTAVGLRDNQLASVWLQPMFE